MPKRTRDPLSNVASAVSGVNSATGSDQVADAIAGLMNETLGSMAQNAEYLPGNGFDPVGEANVGQSYHGASNSSSSGSSGGGGGIGGALESAATTIFGSALGLGPLIGGLFGLFGGGSSSPPPLERYEMPPSISFDAAVSGNGLADSDYDQMGMPRLYADDGSGGAAPGDIQSASPISSGQSVGSASGASPQINVSVQAMDARSFMDYSGEIAKAVRDAMLNLSSINDVVNEL